MSFDSVVHPIDPSVFQTLKQLAIVFNAPVMYSKDLYEVNLPYTEYQKRMPIVSFKMAKLFKNGTIQITSSGPWNHLCWHSIKENNFPYALPPTIGLAIVKKQMNGH